MPEPDAQPSVQPTGWQTVVVAVIVGVGLGWFGCAIPDAAGWPLPSPGWVGAALIAVLALAVGFLAWSTYRRLQVRREHIAAGRAVRLLVLGKATLLLGAAMAGGYTAMIAYLIGRVSAEVWTPRVIIAVGAVVASILLAIAGAFLQRSCRIPGPPHGDATPSGLPGSPPSPG
ncbi:MAG: DUF3180 domain-containing protein [Propionibacteriales bacterium]|nr:DUF3180 domain-containing protein [Propionibacteriales bacterium]